MGAPNTLPFWALPVITVAITLGLEILKRKATSLPSWLLPLLSALIATATSGVATGTIDATQVMAIAGGASWAHNLSKNLRSPHTYRTMPFRSPRPGGE
jgi:hypothetical protein